VDDDAAGDERFNTPVSLSTEESAFTGGKEEAEVPAGRVLPDAVGEDAWQAASTAGSLYLLLCSCEDGMTICFAFCFSAFTVKGAPMGEGTGLHRKVCTLIDPP
jgi:hypothetical protein